MADGEPGLGFFLWAWPSPESLRLPCRAWRGATAPRPPRAWHIGTRPGIAQKEVEGAMLFPRNPLCPHPICTLPPHSLGLWLLTSRRLKAGLCLLVCPPLADAQSPWALAA